MASITGKLFGKIARAAGNVNPEVAAKKEEKRCKRPS